MGYRLRVDAWAYVCWFNFSYGVGADPLGLASQPKFNEIVAQELYSHVGDLGDEEDMETFEWENEAYEAKNRGVIYAKTTGLHDRLVAMIKTALVKPMK
jgi:hypothetical protein|tara:strand:- start:69 stop:365 length:297 start_codon:yes stop_codon:yes gene_type:complete